MTLKFHGWSRQIIGHLFFTTSSFVHHVKPVGEFKLELLSGNAQFGSKSAILSRVTLQFDAGMTLKNNRTPLLCCFKLCASFDSHRWNQTKVTVRKRSIWVKISELLSRVTLKFDGWPWKTIVHLFYVALSFMHRFIDISELKIQSGSVQFRSKSTIVCPVWP